MSRIVSEIKVSILMLFGHIQKKLTTLDIAANRVKKIENISHLTDLQEFWVRYLRFMVNRKEK
jgi:Leucine-rich repeat (LRR) protein